MPKPMNVANRHSLGRQKWDNLMRVASNDDESQEMVIVTSYIVCV
jgi:hypothetical protein